MSLERTEKDINEILNGLTAYTNKPNYMLMLEFNDMYHNELLWRSRVGPAMSAEQLAEKASYSVLESMMEMYMK